MMSIPVFAHEYEMARWWLSGVCCGSPLITHDGSQMHILFQGRQGPGVGPDFRDAVVRINDQDLIGDVELHLRIAGWTQHRHHLNPRYDAVVLHVVQSADTLLPVQTSSGRTVPVLILDQQDAFLEPDYLSAWPCQEFPVDRKEARELLEFLGFQRFIGRVKRFQVAFNHWPLPEDGLEQIMRSALFEAAQYGRTYLPALPQSSGDVGQWDVLTQSRIASLHFLVEQTQNHIAAYLCSLVLASDHPWNALLNFLAGSGEDQSHLGRKRAMIIAWNAVLPVLAAYGEVCGNRVLVQRTTDLAVQAPSLPSNTITRSMAHWIGLRAVPSGGIAQQGLHHIQHTWCTAKSCAQCPLSKEAMVLKESKLEDPPGLILHDIMDAECAAQYVAMQR